MLNINQVCLRNLKQPKSWTLEAYLAIGGYQVWKSIINHKTSPESIIDDIKASGLRGRGGAGFPTGLKWSFIQRHMPGRKYLICNSDEGEPGTCKDTLILKHNPHQLIEGMAIASYAMGIEVAYNYLRGEFQTQFDRCESALLEARKAGFIGQNVLGSETHFEMHNVLGAGSYIVGEETAMIESLEGKRAMPRYKPPFPANNGYGGRPTTVNNTETLASVPVILDMGAKSFLEMGTPQSGGTRIFCMSGHVKSPGVFEVPLGTPFIQLLKLAGGMRKGAKLKAVIPGGTSMKLLSAEEVMPLTFDFESVQAKGSALGSGGVIVMDDSTCMVQALAHMMRFYQEESCGQCTPCREGSGWVKSMLDTLLEGKGKPGDVDQLYSVAKNIEGRTICAFGEAISWPVTSFIDKYREEFDYFAKNGRSILTKGKGNSKVPQQAYRWDYE
ncbi:MAG TPA: NADH-quinone oxidoreductase subunit NuoF [Gammaproteobacteria bacterium]|nr:NADH-quinone oxidoreductase subunit NuoF [Gammaproteobacteria bacterium]